MKKATKIIIASLLLATMAAITNRGEENVEEAPQPDQPFDPTAPIDRID